jgi:hypothetical protein
MESDKEIVLKVLEGTFIQHWDVIQNEATRAQSKTGMPMLGVSFPT